MPAELLLAPVGAGKTEAALQKIQAVLQAERFGRVWVLLASERQRSQFRNRLAGVEPGGVVHFNVEFFTFPELYDRLLNLAGRPTRDLSDPARLRLLRVLAQQMAAEGALPVYAEIASKPGFLRVIADFIYELKEALVEPEQFAAASSALGTRAKDADIHRLYDAYQERLKTHNVVDREGSGWLALAVLRDNPVVAKDVGLLVVDGYDQFTPLQAELVARLSGRVAEAQITLTRVPGREKTLGRRFETAKRTLIQAFEQVSTPLAQRETTDVAYQTLTRHRDLLHLGRNILSVTTDPKTNEGGVRFIAAPDAATETAAVLRDVKRLLLGDNGSGPDDVMIVLRDYQRYQVHIQALGRAYGLPLALHQGEALQAIPPIRVLLRVLLLHDTVHNLTAFPRRDLLDVLNSPYLAPDGLGFGAVNKLDKISRIFTVVGGRQAWLDAIHAATQPRQRDDDWVEPALISEAEAIELTAALTTFFNRVTPAPEATMSAYINWLDDLVGFNLGPSDDQDDETPTATATSGYLGIVGRLVSKHDPRVSARDRTAVEQFKRVLQGLLSAGLLLQTLEGDMNHEHLITHKDFMADLLAAVENTAIERHPERYGRVLVTTATDARGLPHQHIFVMGMSEGVFPRRATEDALYLDSERRRLQAAQLPLKMAAERADDDGLFFELISLPTETLTLSRPTVKSGSPWVPSHLWRATLDVFADNEVTLVQTIGLGDVPTVDLASMAEEVALAVADGLNATIDAGADPMVVAGYDWLLENETALLKAVLAGREVESQRLSGEAPDAYIGRIHDPDLLAPLSEKLSVNNHTWSASQFNDYGICPYRFFAARVLHLKALDEPVVGIDRLQLGLLNHKILQQVYTQLAQHDVIIEPAAQADALTLLNQVADVRFAAAPVEFAFREGPLWTQQQDVLRRELQAFVTYDFTEMNTVLEKHFGPGVRRPFVMEATFGIGDAGKQIVDGDAGAMRLRGAIDRMDRYNDDLLVMDYKTGGTEIKRDDMATGRNYQMLVYLMVARGLVNKYRLTIPNPPQQVRGGFFWHISNRKISGVLNMDDPQDLALVDSTEDRVINIMQQAQAGEFSVAPSKPENGRCVRYCDYYRLCRLAMTYLDNR